MKKIIFFLALIFMASVSYLTAQNLVQQNQGSSIPSGLKPEESSTKADLKLGFTNVTAPSTYTTVSNPHPAGNSYVSACIYFTAPQMANYVGNTLHSIEAYIAPLLSGATPVFQDWTALRVWIKTALDGAVVYEQDVTAQVSPGSLNTFVLTTPYTITNAPLVIGYTVTLNLPAPANRFPISVEANLGPYPPGAFNILLSTNANAHGAGATWVQNASRATLLWGHISGTQLPNDLCAMEIVPYALKGVGVSAPFEVLVYNAGTTPANNFSVQVLDAADNVLGTQTVTTALAVGAQRTVIVNWTPTTAGNMAFKGKVVLPGDGIPSNDVSPSVTSYVHPTQPMGYCYDTDGTIAANIGSASATQLMAAVGYTAANMTPFIGKTLTAIKIGTIEQPANLTNCVLWIRSSLTGADLYSQPFTFVQGWNTITLTTPYTLTGADTYIGYTVSTATGYAIGTTLNPQNAANGGHVRLFTSGAWGAWQTLAGNSLAGNNAIIGMVETPANLVAITTAVNPENFGTVTGGGNYFIGDPVTLTATPKPWSTFVNWTPGNSTANPLTFNASANATYTANFSGTPPPCNDEIIGTGTAGFNHLPTSTWEYAYTQQIYLASEIGYSGGGTINSLAFQYNNNATLNKPNQTIYLANTTKSTFIGTSDWLAHSNFQQVFQGDLVFNNSGPNFWFTIELDTPFEYTGENLVVAFHSNANTYTSMSPFLTTTAANRALYKYDMNGTINPAAPGVANALHTAFTNLKFEICTTPGGDCDPPTNLLVNYNTECSSATLSWTAPGKGKGVNPTQIQKPDKMTILQDKRMRKERIERAMAAKPSLVNNNSKGIILFEDFESAYVPDMPAGWTVQSQSDYDWETEDYYETVSGWQYAISLYDYARNEWMFSPAMALTTGTEYTLSFWVMGGYDIGDYDRLMVRIAQNPTISAMNAGTAIYTNTQLYTYDEFMYVQQTFTVATTGNYYLGFRSYASQDYGYDVCIDDVKVTDPSAPPAEVAYNIYRNNIQVGTNITATTYTTPITAGTAYTWDVKVACEGGGESAPVTVVKEACGSTGGDCNPPTNLVVNYNTDCNTAQMTWTAPGKGGKNTQTFSYTGAPQPVLLQPGTYEIEVWGADGGSAPKGIAGKAGYSKGTLNVTAPTTYYVYVGGKGGTSTGPGTAPGGWNGGGIITGTFTSPYNGGTGGGGTDIRTTQNTTFADRIIVAGGGGGANGYGASHTGDGGDGGGLTGGDGNCSRGENYAGKGGTQTAGGAKPTIQPTATTAGDFGVGGNYVGTLGGTAGGGGWYGGGAGIWGGGAGAGSGYIGGVTNGVTINFGQPNFVANPDPSGNGYVKITGGSASGDVAYNIYRNGSPVGQNITTTTYTTPINAGTAYTWEVKAVCDGGGESAAATANKPACGEAQGDCDPATNLTAAYNAGNCSVNLVWEPPVGKGKSTIPQTLFPNMESKIIGKGERGEADRMNPAMIAPKNGNQISSQEEYSFIIPGRGPNTVAYGIDCSSDDNPYGDYCWPITIPLNNPSSGTYIGGNLPGLPTGGDWINGEWITVNVQNNNIYKINPANGTHTVVASHTVPAQILGMAYSYDQNVAYVCCTDNTFWKINLTTGATEFAFTASKFVYVFTITNDGRFIGMTSNASTETTAIIEINPGSGQVTTLFNAPIFAWYVQDMTTDREDNTVYWAAYNVYYGQGEIYKVDLNANQLVYLGIPKAYAEVVGFAIPVVPPMNIAKSPTNVTVTPDGLSLTGTLTWTNPTQTIGGTALTSITKMVVERNGVWYADVTPAPVGGNMSLPITVTKDGMHGFSVAAVTTESNGTKGFAGALFGNVCILEVTITALSTYQDSYVWQITDEDGEEIMSGGSPGTTTGYFAGDALFEIAQGGWYASDNIVGVEIKVNGETEYHAPYLPITNGFYHSEALECNMGDIRYYNVYRNTELISENQKKTNYTDAGPFDIASGHTWEVKVVCEEGGVSAPISAWLPACDATSYCDPATNLTAVYANECGSAVLTWTAPAKGSSGGKVITPTILDPSEYVTIPRENSASSSVRNTKPGVYQPAEDPSKALWDVQWSFGVSDLTGEGGNFGIFQWDDKLYISRWSTNPVVGGPNPLGTLYRFAKSGSNWVADGTIVIPGITPNAPLNIEGYATDGEFIYMCNGASTIYKVTPGAWTVAGTISVSGQSIDCIAYDAINDGLWIAEFEGTTVRRINWSGAIQQTLTTSQAITDIAWENTSDGTPYLWMLGGGYGVKNLHRWNLTTGAFTANAKSTTDIPNNGSANSGAGLFTGVDMTTGKMVMMGVLEGGPDIAFCYELGIAGDPCPQISNLTYNVNDNDVTLNWTAATGSPTGYDVSRNGTLLATVTTITYTDVMVPSGQYSYSVKAIYPASEDCIPIGVSTPQFIVGNMCEIVLELISTYSSWDGGSVSVVVDGQNYGTCASLGFFNIVVPAGEIQFFYDPSYYPCEQGVKIYDFEGEQIFASPAPTSWSVCTPGSGMDSYNGLFFDFDNTCGGEGTVRYNIYRNGKLIAEKHEFTTYTDNTGFDPFNGHTWTVKVNCGGGTESSGINATLNACINDDCKPVKNLAVEFNSTGLGTCSALVTWDAPTGKARENKLVDINDPRYDFIPEYTYGEKEESIILSQANLRRNPSPIINFETHELETGSNNFFRGANSPLIYTTPASPDFGIIGDVFKTTLGVIGGSHQQLTTIIPSYQAMEFVNGTIYVVTYNDINGVNQFGSLDPNTGAFTMIKPSAAPDAISMAWNPIDNQVYVTQWGGATSSPFGKVDVATGNFTSLGTVPGYFYITIDNTGVCYAVGSAGVFGTVNLANGAFTQISTYDPLNYIQDMAIDRETNEIYHGYRNTGSTNTPLRNINKTSGAYTVAGTFALNVESFITMTYPGELCDPITNLNATQNGTNVNLTWAAVTGAINYEVRCDGNVLATITTTSYTHIGPNPGQRSYCVSAIFPASADCIPQSVCQSITVTEIMSGGCEGAIVGTGTATANNMPMNTYWRHSYVQHIYLESELTDHIGKEITAISYQYIKATPDTKNPVTIYIAHTTKTTFASTTDWVPVSQMTEVFHGSVSLTNALPWLVINFNEPFMYEGGNLVVAVLNNHGSYDNINPSFLVHSAGANRTIHYQVDGEVQINPVSPPTGTLATNRSNTRFTVCPVIGTYTVSRNGEVLVTGHKKTSFLDEGFDAYESHEWCVVLTCEEGDSDAACITAGPCKIMGDCDAPANFKVTYEPDCTAQLTWGTGKGKGKGSPEIPKTPKVYTEQVIDYDKEAIEAQRGADKIMQRKAPQGTIVTFSGEPNILFRGNDSPVVYSTAQTDATPGVYKTTLGAYSQAGTQVSTISISYQAMEVVNGTVYVVTYNENTGANTFGTLNTETGVYTMISNSAPDAVSMALHPTTGDVYVTQWGSSTGSPFGKINLATGAWTSLGTVPGIVYITIDNDGICYALNSSSNKLGTINLANGTFTDIITYPDNFNYIQDLVIDRELNDLYHACRIDGNGTTTFRKINKATGAITNLGQMSGRAVESIVIFGEAGDPCPAITNLNATQNGTNVNLTWAAAAGALNYEVLCDGNVLATITTTSYTHIGANPGQRNYCVRAIYPASADCIPQSVCQSILVNEVFEGGCEGVIVGNATTADYQVPVNTFYMFSYVQHIFDAAELAGNAGKEMTAIAFEYVWNAPNPKEPFAIYIGETTKSTFANTSDWVPVADMTLVYDGAINFNNALPWFNIPFDQPYTYNGGNLVVAVLNNEGAYVTSLNPTFRYHNATGKTLHYRKDNSPAGPINPAALPAGTGVIAQRSNTRFIFCEGAVNIYRNGELIAEDYKGNTYTDYSFDPYVSQTWCITAVCPNGWESEPACQTMTNCAPEPGCDDCVVGTGTATGYAIPLNTFYNFSYTQQIYDASDICPIPTGKSITNVSFQYIHTTCEVDKQIVLYLGNTTKSTFASTTDWVPISEMELVFSGTYTLKPNQLNNWVTIELQTPFNYTGGNIVVAMDNNTGSYLCTSSNATFLHHTATGNKTINYRNDTTNPDPAAPPTATEILTTRNNIMFSSCIKLEKDLAATSISGLCQPVANVSYNYTVTVRNNGIDTEMGADYVVKVLTSNNVWLGEVQGKDIEPGETIAFVIPVTFTQTGDVCIKGRVELPGDQAPVNNSTPQPYYCLVVNPYSDDDIISIPCDPLVGPTVNAMPYNFFWKNSMVQSVYLSSEMNIPGGFIKSLSWFYNSTGTITNEPIKAYLANAPADFNTLGGAWHPESNFTLVYEGVANIPSGLYKLTVELPEPYLYTGGTLIIMTERPMITGDYTSGMNAYTTVAAPANRSRTYTSDSSPFNWTQVGSASSSISNVEMAIKRVEYGIVKGRVTFCGDDSPMEGVQVAITPYNLITYTDANGEYYFPFVPAGKDYTISVTKFAYHDEIVEFEVVANAEHIFDFCMTLRAGFVVYGVVQGSDLTYIEGATVKLTGYDTHETTTDSFGRFEFIDVLWAKEYTLTVSASGWATHTSMWDIYSNTNMGTIILYDVPYPPTNVRAIDKDDHAHIYWDEPVAGVEKIYSLEDGVSHTGWRINANAAAGLGNRFVVNEAGNITSVDVYAQDAATNTGRSVNIRIYNEAQQLVGESAGFVLASEDWVNVPINNIPYSGTFYAFVWWPATPGETHWLGYNRNGSFENAYVNPDGIQRPFHTLPSPAEQPGVFLVRVNAFVSGKGSAVYGDDNKMVSSAAIISQTENAVANFAAQTSNKTSVAPELIRGGEKAGTRGIVGYRLWRLQPGQEGNPAVWSILTNNPVPALEYFDYSWDNAPAGKYIWAVRTSYHMGVESTPAFSIDTLTKYDKAKEFTINVTTNSGDTPSGAAVVLSNANFTYSGTVAVNNIILKDVVYGKYALKVNLEGYHPYIDTLIIDGPGSHLATLIEIIDAPTDLKIEIECNDVLFTWKHKLAAGKHLNDFNVFLNDVLVAAGVQTTEYYFTGLAKGDYIAGVQANYSSGVSEIITKDFEITCQGIDEHSQGYKIYPNPATNYLTIERTSSERATIDIYNAMGMHIATYETGDVQYEISVAHLAAGTYFIHLTEGDNSSVKSFIKK